jgi:hypothetical protein
MLRIIQPGCLGQQHQRVRVRPLALVVLQRFQRVHAQSSPPGQRLLTQPGPHPQCPQLAAKGRGYANLCFERLIRSARADAAHTRTVPVPSAARYNV